MKKDYEILLEYKKSTGDWHYDPAILSTDAVYIGRILDFDFSQIKMKLEKKRSEYGTKLYDEDFKNGKLIPSQLDPN